VTGRQQNRFHYPLQLSQYACKIVRGGYAEISLDMRLHAQLVGESLVFARCVCQVTPYSTDGALRAFLAASFKYKTDVRLYLVKSVRRGQPVQLGQQCRGDRAWEWSCTLGGREPRPAECCFWHPQGRHIDKCGDLAGRGYCGARLLFGPLNILGLLACR